MRALASLCCPSGAEHPPSRDVLRAVDAIAARLVADAKDGGVFPAMIEAVHARLAAVALRVGEDAEFRHGLVGLSQENRRALREAVAAAHRADHARDTGTLAAAEVIDAAASAEGYGLTLEPADIPKVIRATRLIAAGVSKTRVVSHLSSPLRRAVALTDAAREAGR